MTPRRAFCAALSAVLWTAACVLVAGPARADAIRAGQWYLDPLGVTKAWSLTRGAGVKVAVVDNGVDGRVPELRTAVVGGRDFSGQGSADGQAAVASTAGTSHGTEVASVLAGRGTGPHSGVIGVAPQASLLTASVATAAGIDVSPIAAAIRWSTDHGAKVINLSLVSQASSSALTAAVRYAESKDVVLVAATGDNGVNGFGPPASLPGVVAVSGVDRTLTLDPDSSFGHGVALAGPYGTAPGTGLPVATRIDDPAGAHAVAHGTSLAAPIVAGMAALVRAEFPAMDAANVINRLIKTAAHAGSGPLPDDRYGYGIPNAYRALTAHVPTVAQNPLGSLAPAGGTSSGSASPAPSGTVSSAPAHSGAAAAGSSGSSGAGAWIAVGSVVVLIAALVGWFVARSRRSTALAAPGYGAPSPPGQAPMPVPPPVPPPAPPPAPPPPRR